MKKIIIKRGRPKKETIQDLETLSPEPLEDIPPDKLENPKLEELKTARDTLVRYGINTDSTLENKIKELEK